MNVNKAQPRSLLFVRTPTDLVSPLVSPSVRFNFDEFTWKPPNKSSLKKPGIQGLSTPSKEKRVRFNNVASQVFYPVSQFYSEGSLLNNKITRRGLLVILGLSLCCLGSGSLAYSKDLIIMAAVLWILSLVLVLSVSVLTIAHVARRKSAIEVRKQKLGP